MIAIRAGTLIDGTGRALPQATVLVEGERIAQVGPAQEVTIPSEATLINASAQVVMPGLIDAHLHVMGDGAPRGESWGMLALRELPATHAYRCFVNARRDLEAGYTTLRDAGCIGYADVALRDAINSGLLEGPRLKVAGCALHSTGGHMDRTKGLAPGVAPDVSITTADSPDEGRKAALYQLKMGADYIKIAASLSEYQRPRGGLFSQELTFETMQSICQAAHWAGRRVAAHCHGGQGVTDAIRAGVDSLEHGRFLTDEQLGMMAERGVFLVPTLSPEGRAMQIGRKELGYNDADWNWYLRATEAMYRTVERAHRAGVKVAAGSDAAMPYVRHGENAYELELLAYAGLSNMAAICAATGVAAQALDMAAEVGAVEAGKLADLLVVDGDPLADVRVLQDIARIKYVIKGGKVVAAREATRKR
jgi:imidazolonepropionase-like amidohydrolase